MSKITQINIFSGDDRFLSNFYVFPVRFKGMIWKSAENAYQSQKCSLRQEQLKFLNISPAEAKKLGRIVNKRDDWDDIRISVMEEILRIKFSYPKLKSMLLGTNNLELIEGNTWGDTFWGVCRGKGQNILGKLLMQIRDELRKV